MNNGGMNKRNRSGSSQQRRRRSGSSGGGRPQAPTGPAMTALGESTYEAVFNHGGNGYGVWFDGVVREDPMYKQFWKGTGMRPLFVRIEEDRIVLLKELDRDLPPLQGEETADEPDVDAAIGEAVAEAMAAAETASTEAAAERTYSPEEAVALFVDGDEAVAPAAAAEPVADAEPEPEVVKPKRRTTRRKAPAPTEE